mmetsp:Transcript_15379/g.31212  ORF Transcript_15379/g.31212 Transcript_15379/m.31212 type:complete len:242 (+) Transcript_15379:1516-2241(+)
MSAARSVCWGAFTSVWQASQCVALTVMSCAVLKSCSFRTDSSVIALTTILSLDPKFTWLPHRSVSQRTCRSFALALHCFAARSITVVFSSTSLTAAERICPTRRTRSRWLAMGTFMTFMAFCSMSRSSSIGPSYPFSFSRISSVGITLENFSMSSRPILELSRRSNPERHSSNGVFSPLNTMAMFVAVFPSSSSFFVGFFSFSPSSLSSSFFFFTFTNTFDKVAMSTNPPLLAPPPSSSDI